jgi:hypothetical protein
MPQGQAEPCYPVGRGALRTPADAGRHKVGTAVKWRLHWVLHSACSMLQLRTMTHVQVLRWGAS